MDINFKNELIKLSNTDNNYNSLEKELDEAIEFFIAKRYVFDVIKMTQAIEILTDDADNRDFLKDKSFLIFPTYNNASKNNLKLSYAINFSFINSQGSLLPNGSHDTFTKIRNIINNTKDFLPRLGGEILEHKSNDGITIPIVNSSDFIHKLLIRQDILVSYNKGKLEVELETKQSTPNKINKI